jgi:hypothetical protein
MPAFAPNWTGRLKVSYFAAQAIHSQTWRYAGPATGSGVSDLTTVIQSFYDALTPVMWDDFIINSVTVADVDSSIFLPIANPFTVSGDVVTAGTFEPDNKAEATVFVGRSTGGHPWKMTQYGVAYDSLEVVTQKNYRILESENPDIAAALAALTAGGGALLANDANPVAIYNYANIKPNDRWVKKVRRSN